MKREPLADGKIILFYAWGTHNPGDHALTMGALYWLSTIVPQEQIVVVTRYGPHETVGNPMEDLKRRFPKIEVVPGPFGFSRKTHIAKLFQNLHGSLLALISMVWPRLALEIFREKPALQAIKGARLVLLNGGNLFYWNRIRRSPARLFAFAFPLVMAKRMEIPYGFLPQTCGPFEGLFSRLIGKLFENAEFILFRDTKSLQHAQTIANLKQKSTAVIQDLAFSIPSKQPIDFSEDISITLPRFGFVAIVLRIAPLGYGVSAKMDNTFKTRERLETVLPSALAKIHRETGWPLLFVVQVEEDRDITLNIQRCLKNKYDIQTRIATLEHPSQFSSLFAKAGFLISMRLHSMIFALSQSVPCIGLWRPELGTKIPSMMMDMGLSSYCFELKKVEPTDLVDAAKKVYSERNALSALISNNLKQRRKNAHDFIAPFLHNQRLKSIV